MQYFNRCSNFMLSNNLFKNQSSLLGKLCGLMSARLMPFTHSLTSYECFYSYLKIVHLNFKLYLFKLENKYLEANLDDYIENIKNLHQNGTVGIYGFVSDQSPQPKPKSYWRPFLGVKVPVFVGAEMVARELDFGLVYAKINRVKRGFYEASFELITDQPKKTEINAGKKRGGINNGNFEKKKKAKQTRVYI